MINILKSSIGGVRGAGLCLVIGRDLRFGRGFFVILDGFVEYGFFRRFFEGQFSGDRIVSGVNRTCFLRVLFLIVYVVYFYLFRAFFFDSLRRFCDGCFKVFVSRFRYLCYVGVGVVVFFYFKGVFWFLELRVIVYRFSDVGCYVMDFGFYWFVRFSSFF